MDSRQDAKLDRVKTDSTTGTRHGCTGRSAGAPPYWWNWPPPRLYYTACSVRKAWPPRRAPLAASWNRQTRTSTGRFCPGAGAGTWTLLLPQSGHFPSWRQSPRIDGRSSWLLGAHFSGTSSSCNGLCRINGPAYTGHSRCCLPPSNRWECTETSLNCRFHNRDSSSHSGSCILSSLYCRLLNRFLFRKIF